jgi:hypothetical protein
MWCPINDAIKFFWNFKANKFFVQSSFCKFRYCGLDWALGYVLTVVLQKPKGVGGHLYALNGILDNILFGFTFQKYFKKKLNFFYFFICFKLIIFFVFLNQFDAPK